MAKEKKASKVAAAVPKKAVSAVKEGRVTKPAQTSKAKSKDVAKQVVVKQQGKGKKDKKVKKAPTPEPESEESEDDSDDSGSSSSSESEADAKTQPSKAKTNGVSKKAASESSDSSDSESGADAPDPVKAKANGVAKTNGAAADSSDDSDSSNSEAEAPAAKANGVKVAVAKADSSDESSSEEDSDESEDETSAKVTAAEAAAEISSEDDSDAGSDSSDENSDASSSSESKEAPASKKRKADADATPAVKKSKTDSGNEGIKNLFVGNLSWSVDEEWLTREFEEYGEIVGCRIITDRDSGRSKGFGYVEFANHESAQKALDGNMGKELDGRALNVDFSQPRAEKTENPRQRADRFQDQVSTPSDTLFIGNISFDANNQMVQEAFESFGTITRVSLPTDRDTGNPKGFGYVGFSSVEEAQAALDAMTGAELGGRVIRLDFAAARKDDGGAPRGGRGGGFGGGRGGRGGFGDRGGRGGRGGGRGGGGDRGRGRGGSRGGTTNRGGFGDFKGSRVTF